MPERSKIPIGWRDPPPDDTRPWLGIHFLCAGMYRRIFRDAGSPRYVARCPKCGKTTRFVVGPGGSCERFFEVDCGRRTS